MLIVNFDIQDFVDRLIVKHVNSLSGLRVHVVGTYLFISVIAHSKH